MLFGLSLKVQSGEMVALMGRNGMGKTTTIRSIMGMTPARAGTIRFAGEEVRSLPSYKIAKLGIGLVPEGRQIFPNLTVYENLVAASGNRLGNPDPWTIDKIHALFPRLAERSSNMGVTLSGGEQQMLAIGRALMTNPKLLILDEATEGLAPLIREEIWNCLSMLKGRGQSVLVIDKNVANLATHRRPPLHHRARPHGVDGDERAVDRGAGSAAPVFGDLSRSRHRRPCERSGRIPRDLSIQERCSTTCRNQRHSSRYESRRSQGRREVPPLKTSRNIRGAPSPTLRPETARSRRS